MAVARRALRLLAPATLALLPAVAGPLRLGVVVDGGRRAFADAIHQGVNEARRGLETPDGPIEIIWREPAKPGDRAGQARLVDELAQASRVSAILLAPIDRQVLRLPVESAVRAGVPVIVMDSDVDGDAPASLVATDNRLAGREAARLVGRLLGGHGGVLLLRHQIHAAKTEQREEGFIEAITGGFPDVRLVASDYHSGATVESATRVAELLLGRHAGQINAVFASSETGTVGMLAALRRAQPAAGKVKFVGSDEGGEICESALRAGDLHGFIAEDPAAMGRAAATAAIARAQGARIEPAIAVGFAVVTAAGRHSPALPPERLAADLRAPFEGQRCPPPGKAATATSPSGSPPGDFVIPGLGLAMIAVAPGTFVLGPAAGDSVGAGRPARTIVTLTRPFWLGRCEVTQREWIQIMGSNPSDFRGDCLPVDNIGWGDATEFCRRLTERERAAGRLPAGLAFALPTEAQWEYAARAGGLPVADADALSGFAWVATNSGEVQRGSGVWRMSSHPVAAKRANPWGFHDLSGNVAEWCLDWHDELPAGTLTDPRGPEHGTYRVLRGGCWWTDAQNCRADSRHRAPPSRHHNGLGLRVALGAAAP